MLHLESVIFGALESGASDIHLTVGLPATIRLHGVLTPVGEGTLTGEDTLAAVRELATPRQIQTFDEKGEADFAVTYQGKIRMRCNIFHQQGHAALALRLLPLRVPTADELDLPEVLVAQADKPRGLILVTGPTGSGKSSTLAALLNYINQNKKRHIITMEAPIEYIYTPDQCIINQREVGRDTESFGSGLRAALRQDPDVILVGEMRDLETIATAITAAETGHLVFGTLHTKGAANAIDRIIDAFPIEQQNQIRIQLADVLECVIGQALLPKVGGGRRAIFEIMVSTPAIRSMILQSKTFQIPNAIQTGRRQGMKLFDDALADCVRRGEITKEIALEAANDPLALRAALM